MEPRRTQLELAVVVIVSIIATYIVAYFSYILIKNEYPSSLYSFWLRWDTQHYLEIAKEWYSSSTVDERHLHIVFFPLYPSLVKLFSYITGGDYLLAGLIVSNIAYAFCAYYIYKLVRLDFDDDVAWKSVIFLSIFPTAYFFHAAYTESLFIALTIASFYYARVGKWWLVGVLAMLATLTRITGVLLFPALVIEYLAQRNFKLNTIKKDVLWLGLIGVGFGIYLLINYDVYGDPLAFLTIQKEHWSKSLGLPSKGFLYALGSISWRPPGDGLLAGGFEIGFAVLAFALTIYSFFRLRLSYSVYMLLTLIIVTSTKFWLSIPRYTLAMFPIFILLALLGRRREINFTITFISLLLYTLFITRLVQWQWAF